MEAVDLRTAKNDLATREGVKEKDIEKSIGFWEAASGKSYGAAANDIAQWAPTKGLDAIVWTSLEIGLKNNRGTLPSIDDILECLRKLPHAQGELAEEYIRKAPPQIDTEYRRRVAKEFGWLPTRIMRHNLAVVPDAPGAPRLLWAQYSARRTLPR